MRDAGAAAAAARDIQKAQLHAKWRWTGLPLLLCGASLLLGAVVQGVAGGPFTTVMLALFGTGLSLASFGANHDTAMAHALKARAVPGVTLPPALADEIEEELERDRDATRGLRPAPRVALAVPLVALAVQCWVLLRLVGI
jgi:hypothetical protein